MEPSEPLKARCGRPGLRSELLFFFFSLHLINTTETNYQIERKVIGPLPNYRGSSLIPHVLLLLKARQKKEKVSVL